MLIYNARVCALWSYNELGLTNHSVFFKRGYFIYILYILRANIP